MLKKTFIITLLASSISYAKVPVSVTIFPLYDAAKAVGGDKIELTNIIPFGVEAHEFEPTVKEIANLSKSALFITGGKEFEPWSQKVIKSLNIAPKTLDISSKVKLIKSQKIHKSHGHSHESHAYDPHYWLSIDNQIITAKSIAASLSQIDPSNKKTYQANADKYIGSLLTLKGEYEALRGCKNKKFVVNHAAFGYLANDYGLTQYPISGISPQAKPTPRDIAKLVEIVKKEKITTIFFEEFASDKVAKTIATEAKVKTDALRPVENITLDESKKNIGYVDIMRSNLVRLKGAMDCK